MRAASRAQAGSKPARVKPLASRAAEIAVELAKHEPVESNGTVNNGFKNVPAYLLEPIVVDKSNIAQTVIKDGFLREEDVYRDVPHDQWPNVAAK